MNFPDRTTQCESDNLVNTIFGKISAQPNTIVKQICFSNGNLLFLSLFSLSKNWMHNVGWSCADTLPNISLIWLKHCFVFVFSYCFFICYFFDRMLYAFVQKQKRSNSGSDINVTYLIGGRCSVDGDMVRFSFHMFL